jgi:hypothetical protein
MSVDTTSQEPSKPGLVEPSTVQKYLFFAADIISSKLPKNNIDKKIKILGVGKRDNLSDDEARKTMFEERQLLSASPLPSKEIAYELFSDEKSGKHKSLSKYSIANYITVFSKADGNYQFHIDSNSSNNYFFSKVEIINRSKDAYTNKSNYLVKITIFFKSLSDLTKKNLVLTNINDPSRTRSIYPINLIYPYFSETDTNTVVKNVTKNRADQNGIILTQRLAFSDKKEDLPETKKLLGNYIDRNFHLTYSKHTFNMFKDKEPVGTVASNELVIEYVSYEADTSTKLDISESAGLQTADNIFKLLDGEEDGGSTITNLKQFFTKLDDINKRIEELKKIIKCNPKDVGLIKKSREDINSEKEKLENFKYSLKGSLFDYLANKVTRYSLDINYDDLNYYEIENTIGDAWKAFSASEAVNVAITGMQIGSVVGGGAIGAGVGAGVGLVGDIAYQIGRGSTGTRGQSGTESVQTIRKNVAKLVPKKYEVDADNSVTSHHFSGAARKDANNRTAEAIQSSSVKSQAPVEGEQAATVYFIRFGDILSFLLKGQFSQDLNMIVGGRVVYYGADKKYLNYYDIPIYFANYLTFLKKNILERADINYSVDVFINEAFEQLVKPALQTPEKFTDEQMKLMIPSSMRMVSSIHYTNAYYNYMFGAETPQQIDLLNNFEAFKANFLLSRVVGKDCIAKKILLAGAESSLDNINFFKNYDEANKNNAKVYNTFDFQKYIIENNLIPSLLLQNTVVGSNILIDRGIKFSRTDNPNLLTGQILDDVGMLRMPYMFDAKIKGIHSFFIDVGTCIFVQPLGNNTTFGFSGLYIVTESSISIPTKSVDKVMSELNVEFSIKARHLSFGDGYLSAQEIAASVPDCTDAKSTNPAPAANQK